MGGHYCHICGRLRANEKFSGKGHARHICKDCMKEERQRIKALHRQETEMEGSPLPLKPVSPEVVEYVEKEIIPRYAGFDKAHREDHVRMVIEQSLKLAAHNPGMNVDMVYVIAAFHDLGLANGRENHHMDSRKILSEDPFIRQHFTGKQIVIMGRAVEDHRASCDHKPRNGYGMIVAEADRFIDPETIIRRTVQYGLSHYPELDKAGHYQRTVQHLIEKYGPKGYMKIWVPWSDNAKRLKELHKIISNRPLLEETFNRIYNEERNG